ncbi:unnamed protein product [Symbiodinium sp. KB8]|nr:unnamed protein product [Symbiodinium sp. KB8]
MSRRHKKEVKVDEVQEKEKKEAADLAMDKREVVHKRPEGRLKWLHKVLALVLASKGRVSMPTIYDIVKSSQFTSGMNSKVGLQIKGMVLANLHLFKKEQQKTLQHSRLMSFSEDGSVPTGNSDSEESKRKRKRRRSSYSSDDYSRSRSSSYSRNRKKKKSKKEHDEDSKPKAKEKEKEKEKAKDKEKDRAKDREKEKHEDREKDAKKKAKKQKGKSDEEPDGDRAKEKHKDKEKTKDEDSGKKKSKKDKSKALFNHTIELHTGVCSLGISTDDIGRSDGNCVVSFPSPQEASQWLLCVSGEDGLRFPRFRAMASPLEFTAITPRTDIA